jgi:hypothetical protein
VIFLQQTLWKASGVDIVVKTSQYTCSMNHHHFMEMLK